LPSEYIRPQPSVNGFLVRLKRILAQTEAGMKKCPIALIRLPRYMVPNRIYHFPQIPLNVNGKIDRGKITEMLATWQ
jgi:hypothetical protein